MRVSFTFVATTFLIASCSDGERRSETGTRNAARSVSEAVEVVVVSRMKEGNGSTITAEVRSSAQSPGAQCLVNASGLVLEVYEQRDGSWINVNSDRCVSPTWVAEIGTGSLVRGRVTCEVESGSVLRVAAVVAMCSGERPQLVFSEPIH